MNLVEYSLKVPQLSKIITLKMMKLRPIDFEIKNHLNRHTCIPTTQNDDVCHLNLFRVLFTKRWPQDSCWTLARISLDWYKGQHWEIGQVDIS